MGGFGLRRRRRQRGQGTVEYGLLIATGALLVVVGMLFLAGSVDHLFKRAGNAQTVFKPPVATAIRATTASASRQALPTSTATTSRP